MIESTSSMDFWLHLLRFLGGSTLLLSAVWLIEKWGWVKKYRLRAGLWKIAVLCSLLLLVPMENPLAPSYEFEPDTASIGTGLAFAIGSNSFIDAAASSSSSSSIQEHATISSATTQTLQGSEIFSSVEETQSLVSKIFQVAAQLGLPGWLILIWSCVSFLLLCRQAVGYLQGQRSLGSRELIMPDDNRCKLLISLCQGMQINPVPKFTQSSQLSSPVTLLFNEICMPEWTSKSLAHNELKALLAHELGHIKARDLQFFLGLYLLSSLFFFQPLFLVAQRRLQDLSEFLADEFAANKCGSKPVVSALISCAEAVQQRKSFRWGFAMFDNAARLNHRVISLQQEKVKPSSSEKYAHQIAVVGMICLSIFALPSFKYGNANEMLVNTALELNGLGNIENQKPTVVEMDADIAPLPLQDSPPLVSEREASVAPELPLLADIDDAVQPVVQNADGVEHLQVIAVSNDSVQTAIEPEPEITALDSRVEELQQPFSESAFDLSSQLDVSESAADAVLEEPPGPMLTSAQFYSALASQFQVTEAALQVEKTPTSLMAQIESNEVALYEIFNELNSSDEYDITCMQRTTKNSTTSTQICEPSFLEKFRQENREEIARGSMNKLGPFGRLRETFFGPWELSDKELRARAEESIRNVQLEMESLSKVNSALLARLVAINELKLEYNELARAAALKRNSFMAQNNPSYANTFGGNTNQRSTGRQPILTTPPPGYTQPRIVYFDHNGYVRR